MAKLGDKTDFSYRVKRVTKVVDGDTIDVILDMGFDILFAQRVRLFGIDTPESRTRDLEEKKFGLLAKEYLTEKLDTEDIIVTTEVDNEKGKFGRILGWVWCNGVNINNQMIDEHMAVAYHGQSKDDIEQQHLANRTILQEQGKV